MVAARFVVPLLLAIVGSLVALLAVAGFTATGSSQWATSNELSVDVDLAAEGVQSDISVPTGASFPIQLVASSITTPYEGFRWTASWDDAVLDVIPASYFNDASFPYPESTCGLAADDDADSFINDGCDAAGQPESGAACDRARTNIDDDGDGSFNDGCPARAAMNLCGPALGDTSEGNEHYRSGGCLTGPYDNGRIFVTYRGPLTTVEMICVAEGSSTLHLASTAEEPLLATTTLLGEIDFIPTDLIDARVECTSGQAPSLTATRTPTATPLAGTPSPTVPVSFNAMSVDGDSAADGIQEGIVTTVGSSFTVQIRATNAPAAYKGYQWTIAWTDTVLSLGPVGYVEDASLPYPETACGQAVDDDGDVWVNDGCPAQGSAELGSACALANNYVDNDGDGAYNDGCPAAPAFQLCATEWGGSLRSERSFEFYGLGAGCANILEGVTVTYTGALTTIELVCVTAGTTTIHLVPKFEDTNFGASMLADGGAWVNTALADARVDCISPGAAADPDGIPDAEDNCVATDNPSQEDIDADAMGDACDLDDDGDGMADLYESLHPCLSPSLPDAFADAEGDGIGNLHELLENTEPCVIDSDEDGLDDRVEVLFTRTNPVHGDSDLDGCSDAEELGEDFLRGGQRGPWSPLDVFDVPIPINPEPTPSGTRDGVISVADLVAVTDAIGTNYADRRTPNAGGFYYDLRLDRRPSSFAGQPWRSGRPDGAVTLQDAMVLLAQVGTVCNGAPCPPKLSGWLHYGSGTTGWSGYVLYSGNALTGSITSAALGIVVPSPITGYVDCRNIEFALDNGLASFNGTLADDGQIASGTFLVP